MAKRLVTTETAPSAIGAYSQAVIAGNQVYVSGQIPLDPSTMEVDGDEFVQQARRVFLNLSAVAQAAGSGLADAVKLTVYLTDLSDFSKLNTIMDEFIPAPYPARAAVQVAALPRNVKIEIDAILHLD
jgi:reactive intermediate/imine deaminase